MIFDVGPRAVRNCDFAHQSVVRATWIVKPESPAALEIHALDIDILRTDAHLVAWLIEEWLRRSFCDHIEFVDNLLDAVFTFTPPFLKGLALQIIRDSLVHEPSDRGGPDFPLETRASPQWLLDFSGSRFLRLVSGLACRLCSFPASRGNLAGRGLRTEKLLQTPACDGRLQCLSDASLPLCSRL